MPSQTFDPANEERANTVDENAEIKPEDATSLSGLCVASFESRMSLEARRLFERRAATVLSAPSLEEVPLEDQQSVFEFGEHLFNAEVDVLVLTTGVGARMLVDALSSRWDRTQVLAKVAQVELICRGPKPVSALKALGLKPLFVVPEPNTWRDIVVAFDAQQFGKNKRVWVQEYGRSNEELADALAQRSKFLGKVALYAWKLPDDLEPLKSSVAAMIAGSVAVAAFTAGVQVDHVFEVAQRLSLGPALLQAMNERIVVASIGPMTTERLAAHSVRVDIEPHHPKLGHLVQAVAARAKDVLREKKRQATP